MANSSKRHDLWSANDKYQKQVDYLHKRHYEAYSGSDIKAVMYIPLLNTGRGRSLSATNDVNYIEFAGLQTISISSTRSISPVRVLGKSNPLVYSRGARTFAGTLVFATITTDPFLEIFDISQVENFRDASSSMFVDQLPPFSVVLTASNETGGLATQVLHGVTLINYGTTYSVDDIYTETTYSYVATDITNLVVSGTNAIVDTTLQSRQVTAVSSHIKTVSQKLSESMGKFYGSLKSSLSGGWEAYRENLRKELQNRRIDNEISSKIGMHLGTEEWLYK